MLNISETTGLSKQIELSNRKFNAFLRHFRPRTPVSKVQGKIAPYKFFRVRIKWRYYFFLADVKVTVPRHELILL